MQTALFFNGWDPLIRIIVAACVGYLGLVLLIRISGKRTLAQLNAFDFVVTVAFGSTLATVILSKSIALSEGLLALTMLIILQFAIAWSATRSRLVSGMVKSEPRLVFHKGRYLDEALKAERVGREELRQILRSHGITSPAFASSIRADPDRAAQAIAETMSRQTFAHFRQDSAQRRQWSIA